MFLILCTETKYEVGVLYISGSGDGHDGYSYKKWTNNSLASLSLSPFYVEGFPHTIVEMSQHKI